MNIIWVQYHFIRISSLHQIMLRSVEFFIGLKVVKPCLRIKHHLVCHPNSMTMLVERLQSSVLYTCIYPCNLFDYHVGSMSVANINNLNAI